MKPSIPEWFEDELSREFSGRLRIRWSARRQEWHIEEKVGRGIYDPPSHISPHDDRIIRARDGYRFFCAVQPSTYRRCPQCRLPLPVPQLAFKEIRCEYCGYKGLSGRLVLAYFPLGHTLLEHLRKHDPLKDRIQANVKELDLANERLELGLERKFAGDRQDILKDGMEVAHFPTAGNPGKQAAYERHLKGI